MNLKEKKIFISISNEKKILIKENANNAFEKKKKRKLNCFFPSCHTYLVYNKSNL